MYDHVLVPTDGSDATMTAVDHAVDLAERYDADIHVLYVVETAMAAPEGGMVDLTDTFEGLGEDAVAEVAAVAEEHGLDVHTAVAHGTAYRSILEYVDEEGIDLVVMSTRGRTGLDRYLLGSVTEKVVRLSDVPVLTVRAPAED